MVKLKYSLEQSLQELSARSRRLRRKRKRQSLGALSAASLVLFAALIVSVRTVAGRLSPEAESSVLGAFVLPNAAGGYILAGVIAFVLGVIITLLCIRYKRKNDEITETDNPEVIKEESDETKE